MLQSKNFGLPQIQDKWKRSWDHTKFMIPLLEHYRDTAGFQMRWKYIHVIYKFNVSVLYQIKLLTTFFVYTDHWCIPALHYEVSQGNKLNFTPYLCFHSVVRNTGSNRPILLQIPVHCLDAVLGSSVFHRGHFSCSKGNMVLLQTMLPYTHACWNFGF